MMAGGGLWRGNVRTSTAAPSTILDAASFQFFFTGDQNGQ